MSAPILSDHEHAVLCAALRECATATWRAWGRRSDVSDAHRRSVSDAAISKPTDGFVSFAANEVRS